jgi:hypothetical protein
MPGQKVRVRVIVTDDRGVQHPDEDGSASVSIWTDKMESSLESLVEQGGFKLSAHEGAKLRFDQLELGGRPAAVEGGLYSIPESLSLTVHALWARAVGLHVVSAATGVELSGVTIVQTPNEYGVFYGHPGDLSSARFLVEEETSPLTWAAPSTAFPLVQFPVWVSATGHAWRYCLLDFTSGGERILELASAGELEVWITGVDEALRGSVLSLRRPIDADRLEEHLQRTMRFYASFPDEKLPGGRPTEAEHRSALQTAVDEGQWRGDPVTRQVPRPNPVVIKGLAPGAYELALELGPKMRHPIVLGSIQVQLPAGRRTKVTLKARPPPVRPERVHLSGTLQIPDGWHMEPGDLTLEFDPHDHHGEVERNEFRLHGHDLQPVPGRTGWYRWGPQLVDPGTFRVRLSALGFHTQVDTGPAGREDVALVVPTPAEVTLHLLQDDCGDPLESDGLSWAFEDLESDSSGRDKKISFDRATQAYSFRAPAGDVQIELSDPGWRLIPDYAQIVRLEPGENRVTLRATRSCGFTVTLQHEGKALPWSVSTWGLVECYRIDGPGISHPFGPSDPAWLDHRWTVTHPGLYQFTVPEIDGYAPVPSFKIEVTAGHYISHTIELQTAR